MYNATPQKCVNKLGISSSGQRGSIVENEIELHYKYNYSNMKHVPSVT